MGATSEDDASSTWTDDAIGDTSLTSHGPQTRLQPLAEDGDPFVTSFSVQLSTTQYLPTLPPTLRSQSTSPTPQHDIRTDSESAERGETPGASAQMIGEAKQAMGRLLKGKEPEWAGMTTERKRPLRLLDLPVDVLREIVNQLPHTNDLTSLALCHSILHSLTVPCIYSRFDIVWPDAQAQSEPRSGVDALTYGLSTLCMAREVFGEGCWQCSDSWKLRRLEEQMAEDEKLRKNPYALRRRRRGNNYAQFTKKFSLGNGPMEYVQDYNITREAGKMLGTLVALAIPRMRNLETFVWDMPTGVLREVWLSLGSLASSEDQQNGRLEKVWVRWHDNTAEGGLGQVPPPSSLPPLVSQNAHASLQPGLHPQAVSLVAQASEFMGTQGGLERVEHPSFSVPPALKSLSALDVDELPYLDEMSILIARSRDKLRELRVGVASQAESCDWSQAWEGDSLQQVDHSTTSTANSRVGRNRLGGVLGILTGRIYNMRNNSRTVIASTSPSPVKSVDEVRPLRPSMTSIDGLVQASYIQAEPCVQPSDVPTTPSSSSSSFADALSQYSPQLASPKYPSQTEEQTLPKAQDEPTTPTLPKSIPLRRLRRLSMDSRLKGPYLDGQLRLEILELERVPLCVTVMQRAFDWSMLTSLTLLSCTNHEQLWKALRHVYSPVKAQNSSKGPACSVAVASSPYTPSPRRRGDSVAETRPEDYALKLKKIHTNTASMALVHFIRDTLAPNTLETFFLQDGENGFSASHSVSIEVVFRGVLKRHRKSIQRLLVDSSDAPIRLRDDLNTVVMGPSCRWRRWMLNREILTFVTAKMPKLRELSASLEYKDWHYFLQSLPSAPQLRSLHVCHIADHPHSLSSSHPSVANELDPRDVAMQVVDIVALRPDLELCYLGVGLKCFEILEGSSLASRMDASAGDEPSAIGYSAVPGHGDALSDDGDGDAHDQDVDDVDDDDDDDGMGQVDGGGSDAGSESEDEEFVDDEDTDEDEYEGDYAASKRQGTRLRLREILFYDDKVAVFRARHGRL